MNNTEYQTNRIAQGASLLAALNEVIQNHCQEQGLEPALALRDALIDMRHLADINGLDFAELDHQAYEGYIQESQAGQLPDQS
jgi:hypothetical protein